MPERDAAELIVPPPDAPSGFTLMGLRDPHSPLILAPQQRPGLY